MIMTPDQLRNPTTRSMLGGGIRMLERTESEIVVADPFTGEVKNRARASYPNFGAALPTAGGLLFTGLGDLRGRRQAYVTVMTGLSRVSKGRITLTPELRDMRDQTMLFVLDFD
jgi:hypothetical protein